MGSCLSGKLEGVLKFELRETRNRDLGGGARSKKHRESYTKVASARDRFVVLSSKGNRDDLEDVCRSEHRASMGMESKGGMKRRGGQRIRDRNCTEGYRDTVLGLQIGMVARGSWDEYGANREPAASCMALKRQNFHSDLFSNSVV